MPAELKERLIKYPRALIRTAFIIINNVYCIPTYVIWMVLLMPLKRIHPDSYYRIEGIFFHWLLAIVAGWSWSAGYNIVEIGDDISECIKERTLVIANHQSTADVPLMMSCFNTKEGVLPNIMWIMDRLFKYTNFGIVSLIHQDFFIASGKKNRDESVRLLQQHIVKSYIPRNRKWMVLFPEGGFLRKRREVSQKFAMQNNLPKLRNVTLPRVGAMKAIMDVLGESPGSNNNLVIKSQHSNGSIHSTDSADSIEELRHSSPTFEYILDITIAYPNGIPLDLPNIVHGMRDPCNTYFFYRLFHNSMIPKQTEELTNWLYNLFVEKESILECFYQTGAFYRPTANTPTVVQQDLLRFLMIHVFFMTSSYFHLHMFTTIYNYYSNSYWSSGSMT